MNIPLLPSPPLTPPLLCPACHTENDASAVFCYQCHKALGPFRFVQEEVLTSQYERLAERVAGFVGRPGFFVVHVTLIGFWVAVNIGVFVLMHQFDSYPFELLSFILSVEALFITGFLLFAQNREQAKAKKEAELEYEVNVRAFREIQATRTLLEQLGERLDRLESRLPSSTTPQKESSHE